MTFWLNQKNEKHLRTLETKNILVDEKSCKNLVIYFTNYVHSNSIKMLSLHYHELIRNTEGNKCKRNKKKIFKWWMEIFRYFIVGAYMLDKVLDKIKENVD